MLGKVGCSGEKVQIWAKKLGRKNTNSNNIMYIFSIFVCNTDFILGIYYEKFFVCINFERTMFFYLMNSVCSTVMQQYSVAGCSSLNLQTWTSVFNIYVRPQLVL